MTISPILFSAPMIRALVAGRKTQTRRLLRIPSHLDGDDAEPQHFQGVGHGLAAPMRDNPDHRCGVFPPYAVGDLLWVRETWADAAPHGLRYPATDDVHELRVKRPSIHMPRWASRITLRVTDVRVERLQAISEKDAEAEGAEKLAMDDEHRFYASSPKGSYRCGFAGLWEHINGRRKGAAWDDNPWVVAVTFSVIQANVDAVTPQRAEVEP